jgi:hypothetical protein
MAVALAALDFGTSAERGSAHPRPSVNGVGMVDAPAAPTVPSAPGAHAESGWLTPWRRSASAFILAGTLRRVLQSRRYTGDVGLSRNRCPERLGTD